MWRFVVCGVVALTGCRTTYVTVHPGSLADASAALNRKGEASVPTDERQWRTLHMRDTVDAPLHAGEKPVSLRVEQLLADCPDTNFKLATVATTHPACRLSEVENPIIVERKRRLVGGWGTVVALAATGGLVACTFACDSPWNYVSGGTLAVAAGALVVGTVVFIATMAGYD